MSTTGLRDGAEPSEVRPPDVLEAVPRPVRRPLRVLLAVAVAAVVGAAAGPSVWRALQPPPDFSLAMLQGAYTGMVRSDGTNDVSTVGPEQFEPSGAALPTAPCAPLFATTVENRWPAGAVDGVVTYWLGDERTATVSLFTARYPDVRTARTAVEELAGTLERCAGTEVSLDGTRGRLQSLPARAGDDDDALAYAVSSTDQGTDGFQVLRLANTVTFQYRYLSPSTGGRGAAADYDPGPAQQVMDGLASQLHSVQDAAPR